MRAATLALALGAGLAQAQFLISELSFGYAGKLGQNGQIKNFALSGSPADPEVLSNKVILTPPAPGNQRSSVWADQKLTHSSWIADLDFRATGPERGGGNLNIWLTAGGSNDVGTNSAYTVGRFDGLVLVVDSQGGSGGMIRGFLNDRSTDYSAKNDIAGLAFGHCQYSYRNLGRPSQIKMRQSPDKFSVEIDGRPCFETDKVQVPKGYQFGITAASADNPDSIEVFKFAVLSQKIEEEEAQNSNSNNKKQNNNGNNNNNKPRSNEGFFKDDKDADADSDPYDVADQSADMYSSSAEQFADLHNRLQSMTHHISNVFRTVSKHSRASEQQRKDVKELMETIKKEVIPRIERVSTIETRMADLEKEIKALRKDVGSQSKNYEKAMNRVLGEHHRTLSSTFVDAVPGHGKLIAVIVGSQVVAAVGYYLYKRRRANMPKKFL